MNIFIDTSILYSNPLWKGVYYSRVLEVSKNKRAKILISRIVLKELRYNFEKKIQKELSDVKKSNTFFKDNLTKFQEFEIPNKESCLSDFDKFYDDLESSFNINILEYSEDLLNPILERAIKREKPFSEKKTELKDAIIWLTYSKYVNNNNLEDCFFLTENCNDFCDFAKLKEGIFELHKDLKKDCDKFTIFTKFQDFYQSNSKYFDQPEREFEKWFQSIDLSDEYIFNLISNTRFDIITSKVFDLGNRINPDQIFEESHLITFGGYIQIVAATWQRCEDIAAEIVSDYAIISGNLIFQTIVVGYGYNTDRDHGEEKYPVVGEENVGLKISFNFTLKKDGIPNNFEITDIYTNKNRW